MSTHLVPITDGATIEGIRGLRDLVVSTIRAPVSVTFSPPNVVYTFTPDLTAPEQTAFADLVAAGQTHDVELTPSEYQAIKAQIAEIKTFRQRSLATWNGLTAAQREADEIAYLNDLTDVLRALLRS